MKILFKRLTRFALLFWVICFFFLSAKGETQRYRLIWCDDPATTAVIGWEHLSGGVQTVYYGTQDYGQDTSRYPFRKKPFSTNVYRDMDNQFARLNNLKPNTAYYFVIADKEGISRRFWFKTSSNDPSDRFSFIAGGDSRNNREPRQNANRLVAKLRPHAVFFAGDMTDDDTAQEWAEWFDDWQLTIGQDGRMIPIVPIRGNHERLSKTLKNLFSIPDYYAINFGGDLLRLYSLNTEISISGNQTDWLEEDLRQNCDPIWRMAQYHKPMRPHVARKSEGNAQYDLWAPLFYRYHFALVIECDAHTVKTTWPIRPSTKAGNDEGFVRDNEFGTVYVGEGCWGAPLREDNDKKSWTRASGSFNQFKWIFVTNDKIEVRTIEIEDEQKTQKVATLKDANPFEIPANLNIWKPRTGDVVEIYPPSLNVDLIEPYGGQHYPRLPQSISLKAEASDFFSVVREVDFVVNGTKILSDKSSPFRVEWLLNSPGRYEFQAIAYDNKGNARYSCPVVITADQSLLPEAWTEFSLLKDPDSREVVVKWSTKAQLSHLKYQIERASTDQNFEPIAVLPYVEDNSKELTYSYLDKNPLPGLSYYRVRALRSSMGDEFSNTLEMRLPGESSSSFKVYPSPVGQERALSVEYFSIENEQVKFYLFNSSGRSELVLEKQVKRGLNWFQVHPGPLPAGIYYLKAKVKGQMVVKKVVFK